MLPQPRRRTERTRTEKHHLTYPILVDSEGKAQRAFGIDAFPTNIILDREGKVRSVEAGFNPAAIDKTLQDLIAKEAGAPG